MRCFPGGQSPIGRHFVKLNICWPRLAERDATINAKEICYRGGIVIFPLPENWIEEYEPSGGGTFFEDAPQSGTLRLNVLDFDFDANSETRFDSYQPFRDGLHIKTAKEQFVEDDDECILLSWQIGYDVGGNRFRIANFTYTIEAAKFRGEQALYELSVIKMILKMAEFGRELGETGV